MPLANNPRCALKSFLPAITHCLSHRFSRNLARLLAHSLRLSLPLCLLAACSAGDSEERFGPHTDRRFDNYLERLARTLSVDAEQAIPLTPPRPPRSGSLRIAIEGDSLDALDFLALSGCEVQVTIGKRNSSLGRLARDSQRLLLDLEYLRLAPACIAALRGEGREALTDQLQAAAQLKQQQLPALIFNATLGGPEFRAFWQSSRSPGSYPAVNESYSVTALGAVDDQVRRWLAGDYSADGWQFEIHLSEVAGGPGGVLLRELANQDAWLGAADAMLRKRMASGPLCGPALRHRAADILPNVVQRFFIDGIQPRAALLDSRRYALMPPLASIEQQLARVLPLEYREWMQERDAMLQRVAAAPKRHVQHLQDIQAPCYPPGAAPGNTLRPRSLR